MRVDSAFASHPGKVRSANQDALFINGITVKEGSMTFPDFCVHELDQKAALYVVVDGVGGCSSGEVAAGAVLDELQNKINVLSSKIVSKDTGELLSLEFNDIQDRFAEIQGKNPGLAGMAATLAGFFISEHGILAFNYGDCRAYIFRGGFLEKLTHDHSVVQQLCDDGVIEEQDMRVHPQKNHVTRAIQALAEPVRLYSRFISPGAKERFLICCDGVWEALPLETLERCLCEELLKDASGKLFDELMASDCSDNISFILLDISKPDVVKPKPAVRG